MVFVKSMVNRTDIEKALDDLISNEGGMKFQGVAVALAKQRWPDLIACERKHDLGLDAYASALLSADRLSKGLACSLTASLGKIKADAAQAKKHFDDLSLLIFATPQKVTNYKAKIWADEIRKEFGYELIVIPREEIIDSLMNPSNIMICRSHLGIPVTIEPSLQEILARARLAASEVRAGWVESLRLGTRPQIELRAASLDGQGKRTEEILNLKSIRATLLEGRRVVLEAPAGRGKTTTLIQLAKPDEDVAGISFLIDLPTWVKSGLDILSYVAQLLPFRSRGLSAENLAALCNVEPFSFLLNGWNEISEAYAEDAVMTLSQLERDYRAAGICVATRTHYITPLPGAFRAELLPLTWSQRNEYLERTLESRKDELALKLDNDPALDQLTRTPFILSKVVDIFQSGEDIPTTRIGVLREITRLLEEMVEHKNYLQTGPLKGHTEYYLAELAVRMTANGVTIVSGTEARPFTDSASLSLKNARQITTMPEAASVLTALCAHHVLERLSYQSDTFRFQHQQFQEFYAALFLRQQLFDLIEANSKEQDRVFAKYYINDPKWGEPLRMIAEEIGARSAAETGPRAEPESVLAGRHLIELALTVEPIFAAELSRLCGELVWSEVRTAVGERLRSWYDTNEEHNRRCALAGMIATGSADFADIILPLLTSDDNQVRLGTYRAGIEFRPTVIGKDWRSIANGWPEKARMGFVSELVLHGSNIEAPAILEHFALTDPSSKVKAEATRGLTWTGSPRGFVQILKALDDEAFERVVQSLGANYIPASMHLRALTIWRRQFESSEEPASRLRILLVAAELGEDDIPEKLKEQFTQLASANLQALGESSIKPALDILRRTDPQWVSQWVANRILDGSLRPDHWIHLVTNIPEDLKQELFEAVAGRDLKGVGMRGIIPLLKATADALLAESAWARLFTIRRTMSNSAGTPNPADHTIARQLEDFIRALPPNVSVSGLLKYFARPVALIEFTALIDVLSEAGRDSPDLRSELHDELRLRLRTYLKNGVPFVLSQDNFKGQMNAYLATALARVGEPEDINEFRSLIQADIERFNDERAAQTRPRPTTSWTTWHVRAVASLDLRAAEVVLLELLNEPGYDRYDIEAASALVRLARIKDVPDQFSHKVDYGGVWDARAGNQPPRFDEERRQRYAQAIKARISMLFAERANNARPNLHDKRLKELAKLLADLDARGSSELVMQGLSLPGEWDSWIRVDAMEALLLGGAELPTELSLEILNPAINQIRKQGTYDHNSAWLLVRCLCVLPLLDAPAVGIARIRQVIPEARLGPVALRDLFGALGNSRSSAALDLLADLADVDGRETPGFFEQWVNAVATIGGPEATQILLSFIDPEADGFNLPDNGSRYGEDEAVALRIANLAMAGDGVRLRVLRWCDMDLPPAKRLLLAKVIARLGTVDAVMVGLNLIDDSSTPAIPYDLHAAIEDVFLEHRPTGKTGSSYTFEPRSANEIRVKLFEMALTDVRRRQAAYSLLGQIEVWRLEHGRPNTELRHPAFNSGETWPPSKAAPLIIPPGPLL